MTATGNAQRGWVTVARRIFPYVCVALLFVLAYSGLARSKRTDVKSFWDARVYATAIQHYRAGVDPYAPSADGMDFVYPPLFVETGALLAKVVPGGLGWFCYLALVLLATCAIPGALVSTFIRSQWMSPLMVCVLFVLQPKLFAELSLMTGNIATLLYAAILLAAIPGVRRNHWAPFYAAVVIAALIKGPFLSLLVLSWLAGTNQFVKSAAAGLFVFFVYAGEWVSNRQLFAGYLQSVHRQVLDQGDAGLGVLAMFLKMGTRVPAMRGAGATLASAAVIVGLLAVLGFLRRYRHQPDVADVWLPAVLVAAILSNPRMMSYDASIAFVPALFLFVQWARRLPPTPYRGAWIAAPPAVFLIVFSIGPATAIFLLIFGSLLLVLFQMFAASRRTGRRLDSVDARDRVQSAV